MRHRNLHIWSLRTPILLTLLAPSLLSAKIEDTIKETFSTTGAGILTLQLQSSSVEIDSNEGSELSVEIHRTMKRCDLVDFQKELAKVDLTFEQNGNDIRCLLKYENKPGGWSLFSGSKNRLNLRIVVKTPREYDINTHTSDGKAHTSGGGIQAKDCDGNADMRTSGGSINADNVGGNLVARTSGGNVAVKDISGNADVSTSGGSITLGRVGGNLEASTSGGSIRASIVGQPTKNCTLKTSGGSIVLAVDSKANLEIDASTSGGGVSSQLSLAPLKTQRSSIKGRLNEGGPLLKARTSGGNIHIHSI